jgi:predicted esterase
MARRREAVTMRRIGLALGDGSYGGYLASILLGREHPFKTLVIHGRLDDRVPLNHGLELCNILQKRGVRSRFVYYPDENHWILKRNNSLHWYATKREWLKEYLD